MGIERRTCYPEAQTPIARGRYATAVATSDDAGGRDWERTIVARLQAGDDQALRGVYDAYGGYVYGLARRVTANEQAAQDVTQDVFARLWERPDVVDLGRGSLRSFLGSLCHHRSVDVVRSEERRRARDTRASDFSIALGGEPQDDVADAAMTAVTAEMVRAALVAIPDKQREALSLAYFDGLTYRQVAQRLGIPEGTAKSRLRLGLAALAEQLRIREMHQ